MQISLSDAGKRFNRDWIFRKLSYNFTEGSSYAITGPNGSGKSTLLQVIAGAVSASEGSINYRHNDKLLEQDDAYRHLVIAAPYQELIEEMTLLEFLTFHSVFKPFSNKLTASAVIDKVNLGAAANKQIRYFSSGMKQRVKLAQAFFSEASCVLLDEPCTNLDVEGISLYHQLIQEMTASRLVIVSSNDPQEYDFCHHNLHISDWKR